LLELPLPLFFCFILRILDMELFSECLCTSGRIILFISSNFSTVNVAWHRSGHLSVYPLMRSVMVQDLKSRTICKAIGFGFR